MFEFLKLKQNRVEIEKGNQSDFIIEYFKNMAQSCAEFGDCEGEFNNYNQIIQLKDDADAFYNLGVLYATGSGTEQSFPMAARYFVKAHTLGDELAKKMIVKCTYDYIHQVTEAMSEYDIYEALLQFANIIEPDSVAKKVVCEKLLDYGNYKYGKDEYQNSLKAYRTGAIYGNDLDSQYNVAVMYYNGRAGERNIPAAVYWMDKALDNGLSEAANSIDKIINECIQNGDDVTQIFNEIIEACIAGSDCIPKDDAKADYWASIKNAL